MLKQGPPDILNRLGRALAGKKASTVFFISLVGLFLFVIFSSPLVHWAGLKAADSMGVKMPTAHNAPAPFAQRAQTVATAAFQAFFQFGLSSDNVISSYNKPKQSPKGDYQFHYWELWVKENFDFEKAREYYNRLYSSLGDAVRIDTAQVDAKTYRITIVLDGVEALKMIFSKTGVEAEKDADVLAMVDVDRLVPQREYDGPALISIIIDDIGYRKEIEDLFLKLPASVTFAVMPYSPNGVNFANRADAAGREIMLHMPMEPKSYPQNNPGKGGLLLNMSDSLILTKTRENLAKIPHIKGVNNHMGSAFTSDIKKMLTFLQGVKERDLFFVDSRTAGTAKGYEAARQMEIPCAARDVFLDHEPSREVIQHQFDLLLRAASRKGSAIAIGHPNEATLSVLQQRLPALDPKKYRVVPASKLAR